MTIVIATDKFKGSLSSYEAGNAIAKGIMESNPTASCIVFPMADGGDGFSAVMQYYNGTTTICCSTLDPLHRKITACYEWDAANHTAIIEVAAASGLVLLKEEERDPLRTSTRGTGLLIKHAMEKGARKIILGLGGSATNDAGTGILQELGFQLLDENDQSLEANGASLSKITYIKPPNAIPGISFEIACDVVNVLYGKNGAARVYAAQKGAGTPAIELLDEGLRHFAAKVKSTTGVNIADFPGAGAAGGIAAGLKAFFPVQISRGIDLVLAASRIREKIRQADFIITGEGRVDDQSNQGKVVGEMAALSKAYGLKCLAICGTLELDEKTYQAWGIQKIIPLNDGSVSIGELMGNARHHLINASRTFKLS